MKSLGQNPTDDELFALLAQVDTVTFTTFLWIPCTGPIEPEYFWQDGSGNIDFQEFLQVNKQPAQKKRRTPF